MVKSGQVKEQLRSLELRCRSQGLAMTVQRRAILEALLGREDHPSADQIYEQVSARIPSVSRTTVYRVLDTLVQAGAVVRVSHPGGTARFDAKLHQHHHLVCVRCHQVTDLEDERLNQLSMPPIDQQGFEIQEFHIHFRGVCRACRRKSPKARVTTRGKAGAVRRRRRAASSTSTTNRTRRKPS